MFIFFLYFKFIIGL